MQINSVVMAGRLVNDVDYKSTKNGTPLATFKIANNQKNKVNYFRIAGFSSRADYAHKYLTKGERVTIQGRLDHAENKDDQGDWHDYYTIIASTFDPVPKPKQSKSTRDLYAKYDRLTKRVDDVSHKFHPDNDKSKRNPKSKGAGTK